MSQLTAKKSLNISSAMGRRPVIAAPIAAPTMACSLMGVSRIRSGPKRSINPSVSLKTPPAEPMSSPSITTVSSRSISWAIPAATAWRYVNSLISVAPPRRAVGPDLGLEHLSRRLGGGTRLLLCRGDLGPRRLVDRVELRRIHAGGFEPGAIRRDRVACLPGRDLIVGAVLAWVGSGVPTMAIRD